MTSQHTASDGFSPLFSNATGEHDLPTRTDSDTARAQKRSEPNGDHHLTFADPHEAPTTKR